MTMHLTFLQANTAALHAFQPLPFTSVLAGLPGWTKKASIQLLSVSSASVPKIILLAHLIKSWQQI